MAALAPAHDLVHSLEQSVLSRRQVYETHARDAGFGIRFGDKTCFDHTSKELVIGVRDLVESGVRTLEGIDFAVLHEIKHYLDLRREPRAYEKLIGKGERADGLGALYFRLYNCTEDIGVNERNRHDSALFRAANLLGYSDLVTSLYRTVLFKERNFDTKSPGTGHPERALSQQYADYLLNLGMHAADDIVVAPEVKAMVERPIDVYGRMMSAAQFIDSYLRPRPATEARSPANSLATRLQMVESFIEPRFEELLALDRQRLGEEKLKALGAAAQYGAPRGSSIKDLREALNIILKEVAEGLKTPAQRSRDLLRSQQEQSADKPGFSPTEKQYFVTRLERLEPYSGALRDFWMSIPQASIEIDYRYEGIFPQGLRPNIHRVIANFPQLDRGESNLLLMEQLVEKQTEQRAPKLVRVRLVVDASESMRSSMGTVADLGLVLANSARAANAQAQIQDSDFRCAGQVVTFGAGAREIMPLRTDMTLADVMRSYKSFFVYENNTNDHLALQLLLNQLDPEDVVRRKEGELVDIVIEVTDGKTSKPRKTKSAIDKLEQNGLLVRAISIGKFEEFEQIWGARGRSLESVQQLLPVVRELLDELFPK